MDLLPQLNEEKGVKEVKRNAYKKDLDNIWGAFVVQFYIFLVYFRDGLEKTAVHFCEGCFTCHSCVNHKMV